MRMEERVLFRGILRRALKAAQRRELRRAASQL